MNLVPDRVLFVRIPGVQGGNAAGSTAVGTTANTARGTRDTACQSDVFVFVLSGFPPFFSQTIVILNQLHQFFALLSYVDALIFTKLVDKGISFKSAQIVQMFASGSDHSFTSILD